MIIAIGRRDGGPVTVIWRAQVMAGELRWVEPSEQSSALDLQPTTGSVNEASPVQHGGALPWIVREAHGDSRAGWRPRRPTIGTAVVRPRRNASSIMRSGDFALRPCWIP